jgi:hypothetical protein
MADPPAGDESPIVPFLRIGPPPDRTTWEGWQQWRQIRDTFIPAPRLSPREYLDLSLRRRGLHDLHRTATHVNMRLQETPMSVRVSGLMRGRLQNNAVKFMPGTRDGLMINGGGFQGKTETACSAAAAFEDLWRAVCRQLLPGQSQVPGTRDVFVPVAYCRLPVRATPKALCKTILDVYGDPHPSNLDGLIRSVRDAVRDHSTTALLIDDVTRLRLHRGDDQDTLDLIRELMDLNVTLVLIGVDIPRSGLLRGAYVDPRTRQWVFPDVKRGKSHNEAASTQTERRFDMVDLDPFGYSTPAGITAFLDHLAGIEDQLRLFRSFDGMLTTGEMPEYLFRRTHGIRVATALLCASWPLGQNLIDPAQVTAVTGHIRQLGEGTRQALDAPPGNPVAAAGLLTAAAALLETAGIPGVLARHLQASWTGRPSRAPWARVLARHQHTCSPALLQAAEPVVRSYRRHEGPHGPKAPARTGGYRPKHVPAFLEQSWHQRHLAPLECNSPTSMRRTGAVLLVQWAAGGSMGDAADFLGINPAGGQHAPSTGLYRWVRDHGSERFTTALEDLAQTLDAASGLIDYRHRRQALQEWSLGPGSWNEIVSRLPPVPGPFQPHLDDRKRQEASAVIWAHITQGEPRFAPRPIEAGQPEHIRRIWHRQRSSTWSKLTRPGPMKHYAALQQLLLEHAESLANKIDNHARDHSE